MSATSEISVQARCVPCSWLHAHRLRFVCVRACVQAGVQACLQEGRSPEGVLGGMHRPWSPRLIASASGSILHRGTPGEEHVGGAAAKAPAATAADGDARAPAASSPAAAAASSPAHHRQTVSGAVRVVLRHAVPVYPQSSPLSSPRSSPLLSSPQSSPPLSSPSASEAASPSAVVGG